MAHRPSRSRARWLAPLAALVLVGCQAAAPEAALPETTVVVTAAGDYGASPQAAQVLGLAAGLDPDVHLALGDLSYGQVRPEAAWCSFVADAAGEDFPIALLAGNHDSADNDDGRIEEFRRCLPYRGPGASGDYGREYVIDLPAAQPLVRLIQTSPALTFADGRWDYRSDDAHGRWLAQAIAAAREQGIAWVVVSAHIPCLSVGVHSCPDMGDFIDTVLRQRVDLVLNAHEHSYGRTHQLATDPTRCPSLAVDTFDPGCVIDTDETFAAGAGTVFATVGTGGIALRDVPGDDPESGYFAALSGRNREPAHGVLQLRITADLLSASFVPTAAGAFTDAFTIRRQP